MHKILITPQAFDIIGNMVTEILGDEFEVTKTGGQISNRDTLIKELSQVDGCVIGAEPIDEEVFDSCPNLQILSRFGSGYNSIDIASAIKHKVAVTIVPNEINAPAVARHTLGLLLSLTNNIVSQNNILKTGVWAKSFNLSPQETSIGIVGFGPIGQEFAGLCEFHQFKVNYFSREDKNQRRYQYYNNIKDLVDASDIVSLHLNCNEETKGIFNEDLLRNLEGKLLINTSRGELIDEDHLIPLLANQTIVGAALDVFVNEPFTGSSLELAKLQNVTCTSHIGAYDQYTIRNTGRISLENIRYYFDDNTHKVDKFICFPDSLQ